MGSGQQMIAEIETSEQIQGSQVRLGFGPGRPQIGDSDNCPASLDEGGARGEYFIRVL
jgi:hypothetical protein